MTSTSIPAASAQPWHVFRHALRTDFDSFLDRSLRALHPRECAEQQAMPPFVEAMAHALQAVESGACRRLLITIPPRHLKSTTVSVCYPLWLLGRDPRQKVLVASYGEDLARKLAGDSRRLAAEPWVTQAFPELRSPTIANVLEWSTPQGGGRLGVAIGGAVTGLGADVLIIDDPLKAQDAGSADIRDRVYAQTTEALFSRLNNKSTGAIIIVMQRLHEDDLVGRLLLQEGWTHLNLPAIAPTDMSYPLPSGRVYRRRCGEALNPRHEPLETLASIRTAMGEPAFRAQYLQAPGASANPLLRFDLIPRYRRRPPRDRMTMVVQSWDVAVTTGARSDFSVCTTWGYLALPALTHDDATNRLNDYDHNDMFGPLGWRLLDVTRGRWESPDLVAQVIALRERWRSDYVVIEDVGVGIPIGSALRNHLIATESRARCAWRLSRWKPRVSKGVRYDSHIARLHGGGFFLPAEAPWLEEYQRELCGFPQTTYDDQVDSTVQFLEWQLVCHPRLCDRLEGRTRPRGFPF